MVWDGGKRIPLIKAIPAALAVLPQLASCWMLLSLRNTSVGQRNKCIAVLTKLMQRIKVGSRDHHSSAYAQQLMN